jgi:hypothetical protein
MPSRKPLKPGDCVRYSADFLRSICAYSGAAPTARFEVIQQHPEMNQCLILRRCDGETAIVNRANLERCRRSGYWAKAKAEVN